MRLLLQLSLSIAAMLMGPGVGASEPCAGFYARLPNISRTLCADAKLQASAASSVQGRPIFTRDVHPAGAGVRVLVVGAIHGDELSSASVALHWIRLAQAASPQTRWLFIPALNPDGLLSRPARRVNANGVDLNRNFPTPDWHNETASYWEKRVHKDPRRWPGKSPLSEPESKFLFAEMQRFQPHLVVSIHAPYGVLDFDGPLVPPTRMGHLHLDQVGVFPGSLGNYGGVNQGIPVVTLELPHALETPSDAEILRMWRDLQRWMEDTIAPGLKPQGSKHAVR